MSAQLIFQQHYGMSCSYQHFSKDKGTGVDCPNQDLKLGSLAAQPLLLTAWLGCASKARRSLVPTYQLATRQTVAGSPFLLVLLDFSPSHLYSAVRFSLCVPVGCLKKQQILMELGSLNDITCYRATTF